MSPTLLEQRWLSLSQAQKYAGYTDRTLRNWEVAGTLKFHRVMQPGARRCSVRIDRLELDRLIEESVAPPSVLAMNNRKPAAH